MSNPFALAPDDFDRLSHTYSRMCAHRCGHVPPTLMESTLTAIINTFAERSTDVRVFFLIHIHPLARTHTLTDTYAIADVKD